MEQSNWILVGSRADIEARKIRRAQVGDTWVCLLCFDNRVYAIDDECPHRSAFLSDGKVDSDGYVSCPLHAWEYNVVTGSGREDWEGCVASFPVEEREGVIYVGSPIK